MSRAKHYFNSNGLLLNANKTQCMFVDSRGLISQIPPNTTLQVDGATIVPSSLLKNPGIYFDQNSARIAVVQSLVLSVINYGIMVWGTTNKTHMH